MARLARTFRKLELSIWMSSLCVALSAAGCGDDDTIADDAAVGGSGGLAGQAAGNGGNGGADAGGGSSACKSDSLDEYCNGSNHFCASSADEAWSATCADDPTHSSRGKFDNTCGGVSVASTKVLSGQIQHFDDEGKLVGVSFFSDTPPSHCGWTLSYGRDCKLAMTCPFCELSGCTAGGAATEVDAGD